MTTAYTSLLGLALPVQGELSGTWGDMVDNGITSYADIAIAGTQTISGSQTAVTLSVTNGTSAATNIAQAGSGATGSAQYAIINCTGSPASLLTVTVPASSRQYIVINATSTSQSVKIVGAGPTTGVTIVSGEKAHIAWNGSDYVKVASTVITNLTGTLPITNGGTGQTTASAAFNALSPVTSTGDLIVGNGTNSATRLAIGNNGYILTSNGTTATWSAAPSSMTYPGAGIAVSTGSAWTTSLTAPSGTIVGTTDTQTLTNKTIEAGTFTNGYTEEVATANTSTAYTIDLANGSVQILTLTGNCTYTFPTATAGKSFILMQKQDATGSRTVTWPASVKWPSNTAPTLTGTASKGDKFVFTADGTYWWGSVAGQNYL